jgi:hypothetical protein
MPPMQDMFYRNIERHWREHRPRMVQALEQSGRLEHAVEYAARRTCEAESSLMQQGVPAPQAQEMVREEWAFLPSEADVPILPNGGPEAWLTRPTICGGTRTRTDFWRPVRFQNGATRRSPSITAISNRQVSQFDQTQSRG